MEISATEKDDEQMHALLGYLLAPSDTAEADIGARLLRKVALVLAATREGAWSVRGMGGGKCVGERPSSKVSAQTVDQREPVQT